jgi:hypothetical protein
MSYKDSVDTKEYKKKDYRRVNNNSDVDHIYYGLIIKNNTTGWVVNPEFGNVSAISDTIVPCLFSENRSNPYLNDPSEYNVTVPYFHIESNSFPLQIVQPIVGTTENEPESSGIFVIEGFSTVYGGLIDSGDNEPVPFNVWWIPPDTTSGITSIKPSSPVKISDINSPYFYNYSYQYFLDLLNNAIGYTIQSFLQPTPTYPYFSYNPITNKFYFNAPIDWQSSTSAKIIYLNEQLFNLLAGLPSNFTFVANTAFGDNNAGYYYKLIIKANPGMTNIIPQYSSFTFPLSATSNYIQMEQNYSSSQLWNPVTSIIIKARNLNVVNTLDASPVVYGLNPNPSVNNARVSNVLFEYPVGRRADPVIDYQPTAEYVLTNLLGINETSDLQLEVLWKDDFGNLHPFYIEVQSSFVMKLLFRKKVFNY